MRLLAWQRWAGEGCWAASADVRGSAPFAATSRAAAPAVQWVLLELGQLVNRPLVLGDSHLEVGV
jgi:hypothetical protein